MSWHIIRNADGAEVRRVFALTDEDLAANTPEGCSATPATPETTSEHGL